MDKNSTQKCRTCLKNSAKTFALHKFALGIQPKVTYDQLLKDYVKLESPSDLEHLLPQYLCLICSKELRDIYTFIQRAQYCNNKLINVITKKLESLEQDGSKLAKPLNIKMEKDCDQNYNDQSSQYRILNEFRIVNPSVLLKSEVLEETTENAGAVQYYIEDIEEEENNENEQLTSHDSNNTIENINLNDEDSPESLIDTVCPICNKTLDKQDNLITHVRIQHDIELPRIIPKSKPSSDVQIKQLYNCNKCPSKFTLKSVFKNHIKENHSKQEEVNKVRKPRKEIIIKCRYCDYTARTYSALNFHKLSKHGSEEDKFKCTFCSYTSYKKFSILVHMKKTHRELIKQLQEKRNGSSNSNQANTNSETMQGNISTSAQNEDDSSNDGNDSMTKENIQNVSDLESNEDLNFEMFIRDIINIKKRQSNALPTRLLPRRCDECGNIYNNLRALKTHQKTVHITEDKYFSCPHCGKKLKRKANLRIHIRNAHEHPRERLKPQPSTKEKRFMCTECSYVCANQNTLTIHVNRHHTGEKPYKCDVCFKCFVVPFDLKMHRYLHTGERPYKCPICTKGFRCKRQMIKHKRIHNNERPFKCKDCDKSFTQSYNLTLHRRAHLKEKNLNCKVCDKVFENQALLNIHCINENHHNEVE